MFLDTVGLSTERPFKLLNKIIVRAFTTTLDGALGPLVGPGYVLLSAEFGVSVDEVSSAFGSITLGLGCFM